MGKVGATKAQSQIDSILNGRGGWAFAGFIQCSFVQSLTISGSI